MSNLTDQILALGHLRSPQIAAELGCSSRYVRRILKAHGLQKPVGPPPGEANPAWVGGRCVTQSGYVILAQKPTKRWEHRVVLEQKLGRGLSPTEVVDHIDGITIHNAPENLQLFASNSAHLRDTIHGQKPLHSARGLENMRARHRPGGVGERVDIHQERLGRGDVRLRAILRAALELGTEHPCLSGTQHWLEQAGIDPLSRPSLERGWAELLSRYELDLIL